MSSTQASIILSQLGQEIENNLILRTEKAKLYFDHLKNIEHLILPPLRLHLDHGYWYYPIQFKKRYDLVYFMMKIIVMFQ